MVPGSFWFWGSVSDPSTQLRAYQLGDAVVLERIVLDTRVVAARRYPSRFDASIAVMFGDTSAKGLGLPLLAAGDIEVDIPSFMLRVLAADGLQLLEGDEVAYRCAAATREELADRTAPLFAQLEREVLSRFWEGWALCSTLSWAEAVRRLPWGQRLAAVCTSLPRRATSRAGEVAVVPATVLPVLSQLCAASVLAAAPGPVPPPEVLDTSITLWDDGGAFSDLEAAVAAAARLAR